MPGFTPSPQAIVVSGTSGCTTIQHNLGVIPRGYIVTKLKSPSGFIISAEKTSAWTASRAYLISNKHETSAEVLWL